MNGRKSAVPAGSLAPTAIGGAEGSAQGAPRGWYPDASPGQVRWWDGTQWTENVKPAGAQDEGTTQGAQGI
jgi:hypothetical protein